MLLPDTKPAEEVPDSEPMKRNVIMSQTDKQKIKNDITDIFSKYITVLLMEIDVFI